MPAIKPVMTLDDFGIPSNGSYVSAQINAAIQQISAAGGGMLQGKRGGVYGLDAAGVDIWGKAYAIRAAHNVSLDGLGAVLDLKAQTAFISTTDDPWSRTAAVITGNVSRGQMSFQVNSTAGFSQSAWQKVLFRGADAPIDQNETNYNIFAYAKASGPKTIVLDRPVNTSFNVASVRGAYNKQIVLLDRAPENISIGGFVLNNSMTGSANAEAGVNLKYAQNVLIHGLVAINPGPGAVVAQFCDAVRIERCHIKGSKAQNGQSSKGRGFTISQNDNVTVANCIIENFERHAIFTEFYSKNVRYRDLSIVNNFTGRDNQHTSIFFTGLGSQAHLDGLLLSGNDSYFNDSGGQPSTFTQAGVIRDTATDWAA